MRQRSNWSRLKSEDRAASCSGVHLYTEMSFEWDPKKAAANVEKHGIPFAEAVFALEDDRAVTVADDSPGEQRWATIGIDAHRQDSGCRVYVAGR